jgi:hypothetical protein
MHADWCECGRRAGVMTKHIRTDQLILTVDPAEEKKGTGSKVQRRMMLSTKLSNDALAVILSFSTFQEIKKVSATDKTSYATLVDLHHCCLAGADRGFGGTKKGVELLLKPYRAAVLTDLTMHNVLDAVVHRTWLPSMPSLRRLLITETLGLPLHQAAVRSELSVRHAAPLPPAYFCSLGG